MKTHKGPHMENRRRQPAGSADNRHTTASTSDRSVLRIPGAAERVAVPWAYTRRAHRDPSLQKGARSCCKHLTTRRDSEITLDPEKCPDKRRLPIRVASD